MPTKLDVKNKLTQRSDRVKCVDMHPTEPWVLVGLFTGSAIIYNYSTKGQMRQFEVGEGIPIRTCKFVPRQQWVILGSDDMMIRVFNYNTQERVAQFVAHADYIRDFAVHPTQPLVLSASDDLQIKCWNWEQNWNCQQTYDGHAHYVMSVQFNPKDPNTFASASLDRSVKVWSLASPSPNFSLAGHPKGVNCVAYYPGGDKPYLVSGSDDGNLRVWDYQTKSCVSVLEGHMNNVSCVLFHPRLPLILSGSEDGTVRVWHANTYRLERTLNYSLERCWCISAHTGSNKVALGFDEGSVIVKLGSEKAVASMDKSGKVMWTRDNSVLSANLRGVADSIPDGERLPLASKDMGSIEFYAQRLSHNSNGRFVSISGDNEFVIYTAQALRNKSFGSGFDFVWSSAGSGDFAVRDGTSRVKVYKNFKEAFVIRTSYAAEGLFGGHLLAVRSSSFLVFYDWESDKIVRKIDVEAKGVYWSDSGESLVVTDSSGFYVLSFDKDAVTAAQLATGSEAAAIAEEGVESAFEVVHEVDEKVRSGIWVAGCFVYVSDSGRLKYFVGGQSFTVAHLERRMQLLGFLPKESKVYLVDKQYNVVAYTIHLSVVEYQTAVVMKDFEVANSLLPSIPKAKHNDIAKFLQSQGYLAEAAMVTDDPDHKFDLALQLNDLAMAVRVMKEHIAPNDPADAEVKWKQLCDLALAKGDLRMAEECAVEGGDINSLLLLYTSSGDADKLSQLAEKSEAAGRVNAAFLCHLLNQNLEACVDLLIKSDRIPEAAFFSRAYLPSHMSRVVGLWKQRLGKKNPKTAESIADPQEYPNMFDNLERALQVESELQALRTAAIPAKHISNYIAHLGHDLINDGNPFEALARGKGGPEPAAKEQEDTEREQAPLHEEQQSPVSPPPSQGSPQGKEASSTPPATSPSESQTGLAPVQESTADEDAQEKAAKASNGVGSTQLAEATKQSPTAGPPGEAAAAPPAGGDQGSALSLTEGQESASKDGGEEEGNANDTVPAAEGNEEADPSSAAKDGDDEELDLDRLDQEAQELMDDLDDFDIGADEGWE